MLGFLGVTTVAKTVLNNLEMEKRIFSLEKFLDRKDKVGYAAARNTRILKNSAQEYLTRRDELISEYGEPELDAEGNQTGRKYLDMRSENYKKYEKAIAEYASIEHVVDIFTIPFESVEGVLTGSEILMLDWMLEE